jgi:hypothetical protein
VPGEQRADRPARGAAEANHLVAFELLRAKEPLEHPSSESRVAPATLACYRYPLTLGSSIQSPHPLVSPSATSFCDATLVRAARVHMLLEPIQKFGITQYSGPYRVYAHYSTSCQEVVFSATGFRCEVFSETQFPNLRSSWELDSCPICASALHALLGGGMVSIWKNT